MYKNFSYSKKNIFENKIYGIEFPDEFKLYKNYKQNGLMGEKVRDFIACYGNINEIKLNSCEDNAADIVVYSGEIVDLPNLKLSNNSKQMLDELSFWLKYPLFKLPIYDEVIYDVTDIKSRKVGFIHTIGGMTHNYHFAFCQNKTFQQIRVEINLNLPEKTDYDDLAISIVSKYYSVEKLDEVKEPNDSEFIKTSINNNVIKKWVSNFNDINQNIDNHHNFIYKILECRKKYEIQSIADEYEENKTIHNMNKKQLSDMLLKRFMKYATKYFDDWFKLCEHYMKCSEEFINEAKSQNISDNDLIEVYNCLKLFIEKNKSYTLLDEVIKSDYANSLYKKIFTKEIIDLLKTSGKKVNKNKKINGKVDLNILKYLNHEIPLIYKDINEVCLNLEKNQKKICSCTNSEDFIDSLMNNSGSNININIMYNGLQKTLTLTRKLLQLHICIDDYEDTTSNYIINFNYNYNNNPKEILNDIIKLYKSKTEKEIRIELIDLINGYLNNNISMNLSKEKLIIWDTIYDYDKEDKNFKEDDFYKPLKNNVDLKQCDEENNSNNKFKKNIINNYKKKLKEIREKWDIDLEVHGNLVNYKTYASLDEVMEDAKLIIIKQGEINQMLHSLIYNLDKEASKYINDDIIFCKEVLSIFNDIKDNINDFDLDLGLSGMSDESLGNYSLSLDKEAISIINNYKKIIDINYNNKERTKKNFNDDSNLTCVEKENKRLKEIIINILSEGNDLTIADLQNFNYELAEISNPKLITLLKQLIAENKIEKVVLNNKAYYNIIEAEVEEICEVKKIKLEDLKRQWEEKYDNIKEKRKKELAEFTQETIKKYNEMVLKTQKAIECNIIMLNNNINIAEQKIKRQQEELSRLGIFNFSKKNELRNYIQDNYKKIAYCNEQIFQQENEKYLSKKTLEKECKKTIDNYKIKISKKYPLPKMPKELSNFALYNKREDDRLKEIIIDTLIEYNRPLNISELKEYNDELTEISNLKLSLLLKHLIDENKICKGFNGGIAFFNIKDESSLENLSENEKIVIMVLEFADKPLTIEDIQTSDERLAILSSQSLMKILSKLVNDNRIFTNVVKNRTYYYVKKNNYN